MARRNYRRSSFAFEKPAQQWAPTQSWPIVYRTPIAPYASILRSRAFTGTGLCGPEDIAAILRAQGTPAIRQAVAGLTPSDGPQPSLSGDFPELRGPPETDAVPPVEPVAPTPPVEPMQADFIAPAEYDTTLRKISRAIFGSPGLTFEERQQYEAARRTWESDKRAWQSVTRRWEDSKRRYQEALRQHEVSLERSAAAIAEHEARRSAHEARRVALMQALADAQTQDRQERAARAALVEQDALAMERLLDEAQQGADGGVTRLAEAIWRAIPLPADFPRTIATDYETETGVLLITIYAPDFERVALTTPLKTSRKPVGERARRAAQQTVNHVLPLRIAHEVYATPEMGSVQLVGVNVRLAFIDRKNGHPRDEVVASMMATREEFAAINIAEVDPKKCFRSLRGVETPSYDEVSAIKPLMEFDKDDKRIVEGRSVVDGLDVATNLAAMDWEDFEHVVRELFAKMFTARSAAAEVHVTRASRDYGVDALVYDPDPIMGGKYVIQAKRYVNTVDVAAVRDLFGTIQNEGASKGFLVTTSSFGPDAHQFAKGKPLTLIDGRQLLGLLEQYGYDFRIDLKEARQVLHG